MAKWGRKAGKKETLGEISEPPPSRNGQLPSGVGPAQPCPSPSTSTPSTAVSTSRAAPQAAMTTDSLPAPSDFHVSERQPAKSRAVAPVDSKLAEAKASSLRFKLNTPPKATVEVTGIYTDRSHNRKYGGRPVSDGPIRRNNKKAKDEQDHERDHVQNERGRIKWKDDARRKENMEMYDMLPSKHSSLHELPNFSGDWVCMSTSGDWDEFLYLLEVSEFKRKLAKARKWGINHAKQKILMPANKSSIQIYSFATERPVDWKPTDSRSTATNGSANSPAPVACNIDNQPQQITYEGLTSQGRLTWEGTTLVTRMELDKLGRCVIKRSMSYDSHHHPTMTVDLYVAYIHASRTYVREDKEDVKTVNQPLM